MQMRVRGATSSVSPISLQLSALWIDFLRAEDGFLSAGSMDFPRPLNRFLGIGSNFSHSRVAVTRVGFNIQPGGHFKEWHCTITAWFILIRRLGFRWIRFKRNVFFFPRKWPCRLNISILHYTNITIFITVPRDGFHWIFRLNQIISFHLLITSSTKCYSLNWTEKNIFSVTRTEVT